MIKCPLCVVGVGLGLAAAAVGGWSALSGGTAPAPLALAAVSNVNEAAAEGFKIDAVHSAVIFSIKHQGVAFNYGRFNDISGTFNLDAAAPESSAIDVTVKTDSIDTGNAKRDGHLKSGDFFSAKEFPTLTFKSKSVKKSSDTKFEVTGELTLRGQTKPLTVNAELTGTGKGQRGEVAGMRTIFTIKRSDFGMDFMQGKGLADEVELIVSLEGGK